MCLDIYQLFAQKAELLVQQQQQQQQQQRAQ
jgi:hypothetical protein